MKPFHALLAVVLAFSAAGAWAQWQWLDKDGRKVFSDRAPGADIPDKNILKRPAGQRVAPAAPVANAEDPVAPAATAAAPALPASAAKGVGVDKELEAKKKQAADAEAAKKKAEEDRITKAKIENCARAKQAKTTFDSGVRVSRTNAAGEREVMDDAARAAEAKRIQGVIDADCR
ncbi:DUF4124 domain-containing protein [Rhodoferax saidenbachensis]|uniref:DUF4124 domain-containing protein n=1 Tax=Rhodoferax saidenbachensis TaxID=1484693 RepID=A0ABU1ZI19_9BURK|nr:DUF4124 domain-containing protein [Rhodoferax saidenbachensis]MDR7305184.1 hypothetical protein [Rhodoferax saidenbachensis]